MRHTHDQIAEYLTSNRTTLWYRAASVLGNYHRHLADEVLGQVTEELFEENLDHVRNLAAWVQRMVFYTALGRKRLLETTRTSPLDSQEILDQGRTNYYRDHRPNIEDRMVEYEHSIDNIEYLAQFLSPPETVRTWAEFKAREYHWPNQKHAESLRLTRMRKSLSVLVYRQERKLPLTDPIRDKDHDLVRKSIRRNYYSRRPYETNFHPALHNSTDPGRYAVVSASLRAHDRDAARSSVGICKQHPGGVGSQGALGHAEQKSRSRTKRAAA